MEITNLVSSFFNQLIEFKGLNYFNLIKFELVIMAFLILPIVMATMLITNMVVHVFKLIFVILRTLFYLGGIINRSIALVFNIIYALFKFISPKIKENGEIQDENIKERDKIGTDLIEEGLSSNLI